jgi:hypothetical protein
MKRKDLGKRQNGIFRRGWNWLAGTTPPTTQQVILASTPASQHGTPTSPTNIVVQIPGADDTPLGGDVYVGGQCCKTYGELAAANAKFYRNKR